MGIEKIKKEELLECIKSGMTNQEIADNYNLTLQGVKQRISVLLKRENVRNRIELINKYKKREVWLVKQTQPTSDYHERTIFVYETKKQALEQALLLNEKYSHGVEIDEDMCNYDIKEGYIYDDVHVYTVECMELE